MAVLRRRSTEAQQPDGAQDEPAAPGPGAPVAVSDERWRGLLARCALTSADLELLARHGDLARLGPEVAPAFVSALLADPALAAIVEQHSSPERLQEVVARYYESYWTGRFDDERLAAVVRIGEAHDRIGLPLMSYIAAQLQLDGAVVAALVGRLAGDPAELARALTAYRRIVTADVAIVAQTFIDARDKTALLLAELDEQASRLSSRQEEMRDAAAGLAAAAQEAYAAADGLAGAASEMATQAEGADHLAAQAGDAASAGAEVAATTAGAVADMRRGVERSVEELETLSQKAADIRGFVAQIGDIAEQTNLLALNASIEAARAGEHGLGFAVVAGEVGRLAQVTQAALTSINELNANSLEAIGSVRRAIEQTAEQTSRVDGHADSARESFATICEAVEQTAAELRTIVMLVRQVATGSQDVTAMSQDVAQTAERLTRISQELASSLEDARAVIEQVRR